MFCEALGLPELAGDPRFAGRFHYLDLRDALPRVEDWFDEMHPTGAGFHALSKPFAQAIAARMS